MRCKCIRILQVSGDALKEDSRRRSAFPAAKTGGPLVRNYQLLTRSNLVRIAQAVTIGFKNLHILISIAVKLLADLGQGISGFDGIRPSALTTPDTRSGSLRAWSLRRRFVYCDVADEVRIRWIYQFDLVPHPVFGILRWGFRTHEKLVALHIEILKAYLILRHRILDGLILLLELLETVVVSHEITFRSLNC